MLPTNTPSPPASLKILQSLLDAGDKDLVLELINKDSLDVQILNGRVFWSYDTTEMWLNKFITGDAYTLELKDDVRKLAIVDDTVLIHGETGTGKELIARALSGKRKKFVALNCAGMPENLFESELFGYVPGAFTGALNKGSNGLMLEASGGILFLDEIGELPLSVQAKLLRALQEKVVRRVGGKNEEPITCRIVCATHRDLKDMVKEKLFREDLYARISTFILRIKPLRDRGDDAKLIVQSLDGGQALIDKGLLASIDFNLNVRALEQAVRRYKVLGKII